MKQTLKLNIEDLKANKKSFIGSAPGFDILNM